MPPFVPRKRRASSPPLPSPKAKTTRKTPAKPPKIESSAQQTKNRGALDLEEAFSDSLSDVPSDQFEDVDLPTTKTAKVESDDEEEDHNDWEDAIAGLDSSTIISNTDPPRSGGDLELSLDQNTRVPDTTELYGGSKGPSKIERQIRVDTHCMHVQFLLFHNVLRNAWICDKEVQKILVAQLPKGIRKEVERWRVASRLDAESSASGLKDERKGKGKGKASQPDRNERDWGKKSQRLDKGSPDLSRGDPLIQLLKILAAYWKKRFVTTAPGLRKTGYQKASVLHEEVTSFHNDTHDPGVHGERVNDIGEYRNLARLCNGSRDVGAQLFTALLRGLGIESRMVVSLQPLGFGWSKGEMATISEADSDDNEDMVDALEEKGPTSANTKAGLSNVAAKKPSTKASTKKQTRGQTKNAPIEQSGSDEDRAIEEMESSDDSVVDVTPPSAVKRPSKKYDLDLLFPIYWTEVISPISHEVIPVDSLVLSNAVAISQEHLTAFEPRGSKAEETKQVIAYVIAYSQDGTAKDVTTRYLKRHMWPGKTKGVRIPAEKVPIYNKHGKIKKYEEYDWFKDTFRHYTRSSNMRTPVDDIEEVKDLKAVKPEKKAVNDDVDTLQSLKSSAEFALERFLRREEALKPRSEHVRLFKSGKGDKAKEEKVFLRKDVVRCLSAESWHKEGRKVQAGEQPLKHVPIRAVTLTRKREIEEAERETGEKPKQGLYSWDQTEWIIPPPIKDGKIPKNSFGNIDCFVPSMIPKGAVHIPLRSTVTVCKRLGIDYAEAVTGFDFGSRMAVPVITGVIVAAENEDAVIDAWEVAEEIKRKKEDAKHQKLVLGTWRKFLIGLRIAERMRVEYGDQEGQDVEEANPFTRATNTTSWKEPESRGAAPDEDLEGGGFLLDDEEDPATGVSKEITVDHGKESESDRDEPSRGSLVMPGQVDGVNDAYPQTPVSLSSSSKRNSTSRKVVKAMPVDADNSSSSLSDISSVPADSGSEAMMTASEGRQPAIRSSRKKGNRKEMKEEQNMPKRRLSRRKAMGDDEKSRYFE
jgi:xeroderma pigmentosum group C-complementing protein